MSQKTNLNISPYYDDFDKAKNYYRTLFKPGFPVQARELTGLQSILQNQIESFGSHMFKEGSMVIPGSVTYDSTYFSCKVNADHLGIDVSVYLDALIKNNDGKGTKVRGQNSQITARISNYILPPTEGVDDITIFVKYIESDSQGNSQAFPDNEILILEENVTYGNTTLTTGDTILTLTSDLASNTGSSVGVDTGVYYIRGLFVDVVKSLVILDPYSSEPSYRVGFEVNEEVINSSDDSSLNDNAKGFTNYAAPGADRLKVSVKLAKKALLDYSNDTNFVELIRIRDGKIKKLQDKSVYNVIKDYFAQRTYDESGDYSVEPFTVSIHNSLNDEAGSNGMYIEGEKTDLGATPNDDLMNVVLSPGKAYVRGYDVALKGTTVLDVDKPRDTKNIKAGSIDFRMGSILKVNNSEGMPKFGIGGDSSIVELYSGRKGGSTVGSPNTPTGVKIGEARVYNYALSDALYSDNDTEWDLHMFDIQTYTTLQISNGTSAPTGTRVRGLSSGATGYVAGVNSNQINVSQTTGQFVVGEQLRFNESDHTVLEDNSTSSIVKIWSYSTEDIKSVYQASANSGLNGSKNFVADSVLYDRILPNFRITDQLEIKNVGGTVAAECIGRRFSGAVGIKTDAIIGYQSGVLEVYNRVNFISADGARIGLEEVEDLGGQNSQGQQLTFISGSVPATGVTTTSTFTIKVPRIINLGRSGLYSQLPKRNISTVDLSDSSLTITRQAINRTVSAQFDIELTVDQIMADSGSGGAVGISTALFEPFDAERYSIVYEDGSVEKLISDQVQILNGGFTAKFTGLSQSAGTTATVNTTLKKIGLSSKGKDYVRSSQLEVTGTAGVTTTTKGLEASPAYGLRIEDHEISLNVADAVKIIAIYESTNKDKPTFDSLTFVSGLALNDNVSVGEKVRGEDSRAVGQVVNVTSNTVDYVLLNDSQFVKGEKAVFLESNIEANIQKKGDGNYSDRTDNYNLDKGQRKQYYDYSRIVRKKGSSIPSNRLLIVFDYYDTSAAESGDFFTVNSYNKDRYTNDIPIVGKNRATDVVDFRPKVVPFDPSSATTSVKSPFAFANRKFETTTNYAITPNESTVLGYSYYLPRVDKLVINKFEQVKLIKGVSADKPSPPTEVGDSMEVAEITLPPYLYNPQRGPRVRMYDNRRFTMRDIGKIEKRVSNLEVMTSLTALELDTKSLQITDSTGADRFKTGFVVNDFKDRNFIDFNVDSGSRCDVDVVNQELISAVDFWSLRAELALNPAIDKTTADMSSNLGLLDPNCQKTGDLITLKYDEVTWLDQPQASRVVNVNPFEVTVFVGAIQLDPPSDNWVRTIYLSGHRVESTGAKWVEHQNVLSESSVTLDPVITEVEIDPGEDDPDTHGQFVGNHRDVTTTTTTVTTKEVSFTNVLENDIYREFDYVESVKVSGDADKFMRSRNVGFAANGLKAFTKHIHKLNTGTPDIFPKLVQIEMSTGSQGFTVGESVRVRNGFYSIGRVKAAAPNHKFGRNTPDILSGISKPAHMIETYISDPFDKSRPAPSDTYSPTSILFNCDIESLANDENYFGYVVNGATLTGETSGAEATVTSIDLYSDTYGDLLGAFFFRNANQQPMPSNLFLTGTKTFRLTANTTGEYVPPGSTEFASDATGTYTATGTVLVQKTSMVSVRNPSPPPQRPNETIVGISTTSTTERIQAPYRDPLAQSFTVDESGAFLSSVDVYFGRKSTDKKLFVELRTMELGTPTNILVQDYAQVTLNPDSINTSPDASVPTRITFPSPIYLEAKTEYALVFLSPGSIDYEMWVATMGEPNITPPTSLPATTDDSQVGQCTQSYLGGSLFKSQNGSIWTPSQESDLKFTLYKAEFVPSGTVTLYNSSIEPGNQNTQQLPTNPIRTFPRKLIVPVTGITATTALDLPVGRKISTGAANDDEDATVTGIIEARGGAPTTGTDTSASTVEVVTIGDWSKMDLSNSVTTATGIEFESVNGIGSNLEAKIEVGLDLNNFVEITLSDVKAVSGQSLTGFRVGEILKPKKSSIDSSNIQGTGLTIAIKSIVDTTIDTLFLTDVQGEEFVSGEDLVHYGTNNDTRTVVETTVAKTNGTSTVNGDKYNGNVMEVIQHNHGHHGSNNKIKITNVKPDTTATETSNVITATDSQVNIAVGGTDLAFTRFAGIASDRGYALIDDEIVEYIVGLDVLSLETRGVGDSIAVGHDIGAKIQPYEINGMPLTMVNTVHDVTSNNTLKDASNIDNYFIELDRGTGTRASGRSQYSFSSDKAVGSPSGRTMPVGISQNHQFSSASAKFNVITPGKGTRAGASFRTVSGTSADGNEVSFLDQGFEPTILNETTFFPTPRMACSKINEVERLTTLPDNKSLTLKVDMSSSDPNLSPVIDVKNATFILGRNKINNPIGADNYATDTRSKQLSDDPHGSIFVSKKVNLAQPATSLKVLVAANRQPEADFRVYYRLFTADSSEVSQSYRPFPGYNNMKDVDGDGFGDEMIDIGMCDGRPDSFVRANGQDDFSEYQFSIQNLEQFSGFNIKIVMTSTNECVPVRLKDFRAIALA